MTTRDDFLGPLREGRKAAATAERNRAEIKTVLDELNAQVQELSGGALTITRQARSGPSDAPMPVGTRHILEPPPRRYTALVVRGGDATHDLCEFEEGSMGCPVRLRHPGYVESAHDRASLAAALRELLATPHAGRAFNELLGTQDILESAASHTLHE